MTSQALRTWKAESCGQLDACQGLAEGFDAVVGKHVRSCMEGVES